MSPPNAGDPPQLTLLGRTDGAAWPPNDLPPKKSTAPFPYVFHPFLQDARVDVLMPPISAPLKASSPYICPLKGLFTYLLLKGLFSVYPPLKGLFSPHLLP